MRFKLISDNTDTLVGMRLAGITGVMAKTPEEVKKAINDAIKTEDVAIVLITEKLVNMCSEFIYDLKSTSKRPLIVEIPDSNSPGSKKDSITKYIRDAIGLKI
ncbi:MAG: V-type ATP synthase subunit F [Clostridia bacterium]|nr:V-type ATP synthase subunit F [Clostridia bacterium]